MIRDIVVVPDCIICVIAYLPVGLRFTIGGDFFRFLDALEYEPPWEAYWKHYYDPHQAFLNSYWRTFRWMDLGQVRSRVEQAKRMKELEKENARLKKLVADLSLDNAILKEAAEGNF